MTDLKVIEEILKEHTKLLQMKKDKEEEIKEHEAFLNAIFNYKNEIKKLLGGDYSQELKDALLDELSSMMRNEENVKQLLEDARNGYSILKYI